MHYTWYRRSRHFPSNKPDHYTCNGTQDTQLYQWRVLCFRLAKLKYNNFFRCMYVIRYFVKPHSDLYMPGKITDISLVATFCDEYSDICHHESSQSDYSGVWADISYKISQSVPPTICIICLYLFVCMVMQTQECQKHICGRRLHWRREQMKKSDYIKYFT